MFKSETALLCHNFPAQAHPPEKRKKSRSIGKSTPTTRDTSPSRCSASLIVVVMVNSRNSLNSVWVDGLGDKEKIRRESMAWTVWRVEAK